MSDSLFPCPICGEPYSTVDPKEWHVDPYVCKKCRAKIKALEGSAIDHGDRGRVK